MDKKIVILGTTLVVGWLTATIGCIYGHYGVGIGGIVVLFIGASLAIYWNRN